MPDESARPPTGAVPPQRSEAPPSRATSGLTPRTNQRVTPPSSMDARPSERPPAQRVSRKLLAALAVVIAAALTIQIARWADVPDQVPLELVGQWRTDDPRYEGRSLVFTRDSLIYDAGPEGATAYLVRRVQRRLKEAVTEQIVITYVSEGEENTLSLEYRVAQGILELEHPDDVRWTRTP